MNALDQTQVLAIWLAAFDDLEVVSSACGADGQDVCWTQLLELCENAPVVLEDHGISLDNVPNARKMADAGGLESAILSLLNSRAGFLVSRGGTGTCLASVALNEKEVTAEGNTLALALIAAISLSIIEAVRDIDLGRFDL